MSVSRAAPVYTCTRCTRACTQSISVDDLIYLLNYVAYYLSLIDLHANARLSYSYVRFARCFSCIRVSWHGLHKLHVHANRSYMEFMCARCVNVCVIMPLCDRARTRSVRSVQTVHGARCSRTPSNDSSLGVHTKLRVNSLR